MCAASSTVRANSEARDATSLGVLELTLGARPTTGATALPSAAFTDSGSRQLPLSLSAGPARP